VAKFDGTIKIGAAMDSTGKFAPRAAAISYGFQAGVAKINQSGGVAVGSKHYRVDLLTTDAQDNITLATAQTTGMIQDNQVAVITGPSDAAEQNAQCAAAAQTTTVLCLQVSSSLSQQLGQGTSSFNEKAFAISDGFGVNTADLFPAWMNMMKALWLGTASTAFLLEDDTIGKVENQVLVPVATKAGLKITNQSYYNTQNSDFSSQLTTIKATHPNTMIFGFDQPLDATIIKQAGQLQAAKGYLTSDDNSVVPSGGVGAPVLSVGAGGIYGDKAASEDRVKLAGDMAKLIGKPFPTQYTYYAVEGYVELLLWAKAVTKAGTYTDSAKVQGAILHSSVTLTPGDTFEMNPANHGVLPKINQSGVLVAPNGQRQTIDFSPDGSKIVAKKNQT
jgi:ABC-type branched-subunit amino acid transport system substrate-binding protein